MAPPHYTEKEWLAKVAEFRWLCYYCGVALRLPSAKGETALTKDHCIPIAMGGVDELWNIVPACARCNRIKRKKTSAQFIAGRSGLCSHVLQEASFIHVSIMYRERKQKHALEEISAFVQKTARKKAL
jgi:hypothetical protein